MFTVLFACVQNAGRSQMAAAFFNAQANPSLARAISAGTRPAPRVHPEVVEAMRECGVELSGVRPRPVTPELIASAQLLVTMGCGEGCPAGPGVPREDWPLANPDGEAAEAVRAIRDEIRERVRRLIESERWSG